MKNGIHINTANLDDLKKHFSFLSKSFIAETNQKIQIAEYIEKIFRNAVLYEFWENDILVGIAAVYENRGVENPAYLTDLSVIESQNGKGIGSKLMNYSIKNLKDKGFTEFMLEVKKENTIAESLYKKCGFIILDEKEKNSWLMKLNL